MSAPADYPRDLVGYGRQPPFADWPGRARVAVQFVLNYEEGGENCVLHGDAGSEQFLSEMFNPPSYPGRHLSMEGIYEYGSRVGVWRILREFERRGLPLTVFGVAMALQRHPELTAAFRELGHEIACHGWRWINYQAIDEATEREHMRIGMEIIERLTGERPWAGTPAATRPTPGAWWPTTAAFCTTPTTTATTCPSGPRSPAATAAACPTWWCPTPSTPTTCASRCPRAFPTAASSSTTCATPSTCSTPRATSARRC
jgi:peptidoglycan/xylan/chitin deacetylase (PgdA/CDA1 family)